MNSLIFMLSVSLIVGPISGQVSSTSAPFTCPPDALGPVAIADQCVREYYICLMGNAISQTCPGTWLFDPETLVCAPPDVVSCLKTPTPPGPSTAAPPFNCPANVTALFPSSDQCVRNYFSCVNGLFFMQTCPGATLFDPLTLQCAAPGQCLASAAPSSSSEASSPADQPTSPATTTAAGAGSTSTGEATTSGSPLTTAGPSMLILSLALSHFTGRL